MSLAGCQANADEEGELHGRILLWHSWSVEETAVLEQILQQFMDIHPGVTIIATAIPANELLTRYENAAPQGLGPNLLIGDADWIPDLAAEGYIADFGSDKVSSFNFLPPAIRALRLPNDEGLYGLPLSVSTNVLYYNISQVERAAVTLEELWLQAEDGRIVALPTTFDDAYWGIPTFGEALFNDDGNFTLTESGFLGWLNALKEVQEIPNVVLSRDVTALQQLFLSERAAYYVGRSEEMPVLQAALGEFAVGVASLPSGPVGSSRSLLWMEAVMLNTASSAQQTAVALEIAQFLTNQEQSTLLMRQAGRVPANRRVEVNRQIYPAMSGFVIEARTAMTLPKHLSVQEITELGDLTYANVLSGLLTPLEAVCDFGRGVLEIAPALRAQATLPMTCPDPTEDT
jgi:arabinogalactan oligomer/maltooligosaccharide transport system substrate-binding protein